MVDGEAIAVDENGLSAFDLIRYRQQDHAVTLCALLELDGEDLRRTPIEVRKATLKGLLRRIHAGIAFNRHFEAAGDIVCRHACKLGCEGIVSKRFGSPYRAGRVDHWLKGQESGRAGSEARGRRGVAYMSNLLQQAINCDDGERAAKILQQALGIDSDNVVNYCFPQSWPNDRELRARIIGEWLRLRRAFWPSLSGLFSFRGVAQNARWMPPAGAFRPGKGKAPYPCPWRGRR